jgi:hypothetical protein
VPEPGREGSDDDLAVTGVVHAVEADDELRNRQFAAIVRLLRHAAELKSDAARSS